MNDYYVYAHHLPDGTIFYIGKGKNKRIFSKSGRSEWWHRITKKYYGKGFPVYSKLIENVSENEAFSKEKELIQLYGRKDVNGGMLINMTDGGDGPSGHKHTIKSRLLMSNKRKGAVFSDDHKNNLSKSAKERVKSNPTVVTNRIVDMVNARRTFVDAVLEHVPSKKRVTVTNVSEFAKQNKLHQGHISDVICGNRKSHGGWILITKRNKLWAT